MSRCNRCTLQQIERRAREEGKRVFVRSLDFGLGGVAVYVAGSRREKLSDDNRVAWFAELTEECEC